MWEWQDFPPIFSLMKNDAAPSLLIEYMYTVSWHIYVYPPINSPNYFTQDDKIEAVFSM
jgi:hypothetical protein